MLADADLFTARLRSDPERRAFLAGSASGDTAFVTRAPGRLDVMGGVGDYSGCLVAEATIAEAALVGLSCRSDRQLRFWSVGIEDDGFSPLFSCSLDAFYDGGALKPYADVCAHFSGDARTRWAAYLVGCFYVLLAEGIVPCFPGGANVLLESRVPLGAGVSSSAAIEVATMQAVNVAYNLKMNGVVLARMAQKVENEVVGAPCGIMDQMTSALGVENSLLLILCQPHEVQGTQTWPDNVRFFGINSSVKHAVGGEAYTRARVAAFMGRKILGVDYLANIPVQKYINSGLKELLESITGQEFLAAHGETGDAVTRIDPLSRYPVHAATKHAIQEHDRVQQSIHLLSTDSDGIMLERVGRLMYASHASYSAIGLGSDETDLLVQMGREAGPDKGIYGAKITGGGSGGTVAFLTCGEQAEETITDIVAEYERRTGRTPDIFEAGKSPGALAFGHREIPL